MGNENFRHELGHVFDDMAGSPSSALPDRVRSSLAHVPEQRGPYWIAGLAAALIAAVVIGVLVVANPLNRPVNTIAPGVGTSPSPTPNATPRPDPSPDPKQSQYLCTGDSAMHFDYAQAPSPAVIDALRMGTHAGYDRLAIDLKSGGMTDVELHIQTGTTFMRSPRGDQVTLAGKNGILLVIHNADLHTGYAGPADVKTGYATLVEVQKLEDFEGVVQLGIGVSGTTCYRIFTLSSPNRLVIDVQAAS